MNTQSPGGSIILKCKDFHILQLDINSTEDLTNVVLSIEMLMSQGEIYNFILIFMKVHLCTSHVNFYFSVYHRANFTISLF